MKTSVFRGTTVTDEQVLEAMERFDREYRNSFPLYHWDKYAVKNPNNNEKYPPKQLLRIATGAVKVPGGGRPINSVFERLGFTVVLLDESDLPIPNDDLDAEENETSFSYEDDLERSLVGNLDQLELGLELYQNADRSGQQFDTKEAGRIDLLTIDKNNDFLVIELKAIEADREVCGQIQAYMGWVKEHLAGPHNVRGVIIAPDFTKRAIYAANVVPGLKLKRYRVSFQFDEVTSN